MLPAATHRWILSLLLIPWGAGCVWITDRESEEREAIYGGECLVSYWWLDADGDGFGGDLGVASCSPPATSYVSQHGDCDDLDPERYPGAPELCDGLSQDCDAVVDENAEDAPTWYLDQDGDGYGIPQLSTTSCELPSGFAAESGDCDDERAAINPGRSETCGDSLDNDCDDAVDEGREEDPPWWPDRDGDGFGDEAEPVMACEAPEDHTEFGGDCDDSDDSVHPAAVEICGDGVDNDCDGQHPSCGHQGELSLSAEESWSPGEGSWGSVAVGSSRVQGGELAELLTSDPDQATAVLLGVQRDQIETLATLRGAEGSRFGRSLVNAMDLNEDGYGDLLIGEAQGVHLFMGPLEDDSQPYWTLRSSWSRAGLGGKMARLEAWGAAGEAGVVVAAEGLSRLSLFDWDQEGEIGLGEQGVSLSLPEGELLQLLSGDLNGDGWSDLVLSLQREASGESELLLIRGPLDSDEDLSSAQGLLASEDQALGACLSLMSDADGDGYPELIAGAPGRGSAGEAFLFSGPLRQAPELADAELRWLGEGEGDRLGSHCSTGDFDGDGAWEVLLGAEGVSSVYRLLLTEPGVVSVSKAPARWTLPGLDLLTRAGDLDGDGPWEFILGQQEQGLWWVWGQGDGSDAEGDTGSDAEGDTGSDSGVR